jgi:Domain of unknown function (DUF5063)
VRQDLNTPSLDSPAVRAYSDSAQRYCAVVRAHANGSLGRFLRDVEPTLPALYGAAAHLPAVVPDTSDAPEPAADRAEYHKLEGSLAALLGRHDAYREIFDPSETPTIASLFRASSVVISSRYWRTSNTGAALCNPAGESAQPTSSGSGALILPLTGAATLPPRLE